MAALNKELREYVDFDVTFTKHPVSKNLTLKKSINAVKQSILHLMTLKVGDKPFHPEIVSPVYGYMFENLSTVHIYVLESEVIKYLSIYEPRVRIDSVKVSASNPNEILCYIVGEIISTSTPFDVNVLIDRLR